VFCKFIESRETFRLAGNLKSLLATCVVNLARDKLRARKLQTCDADEATARCLDTNEPDHDAIFGEQARDLNRAMAQLAYEQREVIMLHLRGGMRFREIAGLQNVSTNTAKSRYRYGLQKLRNLLSDEEKKDEIRKRNRTSH
jgi:RNA polymerase sigma factor (sigma-70 family)